MTDAIQLNFALPANDNALATQPTSAPSQSTGQQIQEAVASIYEQNLIELSKQKVRPFVPEGRISEVVGDDGRIDYRTLNNIMLEQSGARPADISAAQALDITA